MPANVGHCSSRIIRWSPAVLDLMNSIKSSNGLQSFCFSNRRSLFCQFANFVELWRKPRPSIPAAAKICRQHAGLTTVESAVFALIGLLLAFTISDAALQWFDERRQLVIQEEQTRLAQPMIVLVCLKVARNLQTKLKDYASVLDAT